MKPQPMLAPPTPSTGAPANPQPMPSLESSRGWAPQPTARGRFKTPGWRAVLGVSTLALLATGGYVGVKQMSGSAGGKDMQLFQVARRSFPVILQEKGELKAASIIDVRCELEGKSTIIFLVPEGTHVKKGDLLVELASDEIDEKIRDAGIKVATAKAAHEAALKELQILKDKNQSDIDKAKLTLWLAQHAIEKYNEGDAVVLKQTDDLALQKAEYVLDRAEKKLKDSEELEKKGFITRIELENDKFDVLQGKMELEKAKLALKVTQTYTIPMAVQEKQSAVREAEKEVTRAETAREASEAKSAADVGAKGSELKIMEDKLAKLRDQKIKSRVIAPSDGLVVYCREDWDEEPKIKAGAQVVERQRMIELPDTSSMKASIRVHEAKIEKLKLGLTASVQIEGFTGRQFTGKVSRIAVLADSRNWFNRNLKEYETEVLLDGRFTDLKPGTSAKVDVLVTELNDVLAVPVQSIFGKAGKYYVFIDEKGDCHPIEIKLGLSSTEYVQVKEGLKEGDTIRLAISDELKLKLPGGDSMVEDETPKTPRRRAASQPAIITSQPAVTTTKPAGPVVKLPATQPGPA